MKIGVILFIFLLMISLVVAQDATVSEKGYACLEDKVTGKCSSLSSEEKIFSLLTIDRCKTEVLNDATDEECWPDSGCKVKTTAQAILALNSVGVNTDESENWLLGQKINPPDVDWLLQIDPTNPSDCSIIYQGDSHEISISEDKKINRDAGSCLKRYEDDYWLKVSPSCYEEEFTISCDETFSTSLLYKKKDSGIFYISKTLNSASAEGTTIEKINSFCFKQGTACNYEATLWAALILKFRGHNISPYLPYLITMAEENQEFVPESFLYSLTNNFKDELLLKQKENEYWSESGDKFYDTAVALYSLQSEELEQKTNAKTWLEEVQGTDGCWQGNIQNTAFILFSVWPKKTFFVDESDLDCEEEGNYCMSSSACNKAGGKELDYSGCFANVCCDTQRLLESCSIQDGEKCASDEICLGGTFTDAADSERCCVKGECVVQDDDVSECEARGGECKTTCSNNEETTSDDCPSFDLCCIKETKETNYVLILVLGILILLLAIGIIFRDKLRKFWFKIKSKFKRGKSGPSSRGPPRFPPGPSSAIGQRPTQRRVFPPTQRPARRPAHRPKGELDNVLKKLKEMGK